jgi:hypothetical protein
MEPISEAIVCESSPCLTKRTFIRMMSKIMLVLIANGLPTTRKNQKF